MIRSFKIFEHFGTGEESFTEKLESGGKLSNLDIYAPLGWGDIESATGEMTYTASLDVRRGGIEDINFRIDKIDIEVEIREYENDDDDGKLVVKTLSFDKNNMGTDPVIELHDLPFYVRTLEIDMRNSEDVDGEIDMKKIKFQLDIGHIE